MGNGAASVASAFRYFGERMKHMAKKMDVSGLESTGAPEGGQIDGVSVRLVYVGPNIPGGILQRFQVFKGGLPPHAKGLIEQVPEIGELFVPVKDLESMRRKIEDPGTNEARLFYAVQQATARGVK